jgi:hypothetical protein
VFFFIEDEYCVRLGVHPPAAGSGLTLAVEVDGGDGLAEVVELGKVPGVEVLAPPGGVHRLPPQLLEQHQDEAVDPHGRTWALVAYHLLTKCCPGCAWNVSDQPDPRKRGSVQTYIMPSSRHDTSMYFQHEQVASNTAFVEHISRSIFTSADTLYDWGHLGLEHPGRP